MALNWRSFEGMNCMLQHEMKRSLTGLWSHFRNIFSNRTLLFAHAATSIPPAGYLKHRVPTRGKLKLQDPAGDTHATRCQNTGPGEMGKVARVFW